MDVATKQKREQELRNSIGQLEASLDVGGKYMNNEQYDAFCHDIHACIAKLRIALRSVSGELVTN